MPLSAPIHSLKRRAKLLARDAKIPLHEALDRIARNEGYTAWSLLSSQVTRAVPAVSLSDLRDGETLLVAARPGQGKTRLAARLLLDAVREGRQAVFFTFEYTPTQAARLFREVAGEAIAAPPEIETSEDIDAALIIARMAGAPAGSVAVIDYLQLLDQKRTKPPLFDQMLALKAFAEDRGVILVFLSQIDRSFGAEPGKLPTATDIRLPNAVPDGVFSMTGFLHAGRLQLDR